MSESSSKPRKRREGPWDWLFEVVIGGTFNFITWMITTIVVAVIVELIGSYWWGHHHSQEILEKELSYVGTFQRNLLTGYYPSDIAKNFVSKVDAFISFTHLQAISDSLATKTHSAAALFASYGIQTFINTLFIFALRLSVCASAMTGFILVAIVSAIDGLVERDIRRACGGIESAIVYHRAKRLIMPLIFISFGIYMGSPVSIHPTVVFVPVMLAVGVSIYYTTSRFKKYL